MFEIIDTLKEGNIDFNYIALGYLELQEGTHSSLIISFNKQIYECHYYGNGLECNPVKHDYLHKETLTIHKEEISSFLVHCNYVAKNANPKYGYFYDGEYYKDGVHFSEDNSYQIMTCVGFCLNILKGWFGRDYINYIDWSSESVNIEKSNSEYVEWFCEKHGLDKEKLAKKLRRISPIEFLTSGFFENLPISKRQIDNQIDYVEDEIKRKKGT